MSLLATLNLGIAAASLVMLVVSLALIVDYVACKGKYFSTMLQPFIWPVILVLTVCSVVMSLVYSEYFGFVPCSLCWLQRIAIYPQALMALVAYKIRDERFFPLYGIGLSIAGFLVAVYQYVYQLVPKESLATGVVPCLLDGSNADCAVKVIDEFGFVTFPFVSAVTFVLLIMLYLYMRKGTVVQNAS